MAGSFSRFGRWIVVALLVAPSFAQLEPLPQDQGIAGLYQRLRQLRTTARALHITAHPDDEDGAFLALQSRGRGATVRLFTLTRGEGGQNQFGGEIADELGVLRTLELLAADRYYGADQRFGRVVDFGFSKNAGETFQKWGGHDTALAGMVREIRAFRPDIVVSRFQGGAPDGHGNHQASGILSREAFRAAADPNRFPEQIREGLQPWQAKKLYAGIREMEPGSARFDSGEYSPILGTSFVQFALAGLSHQLSQGVSGIEVLPGQRFRYYKLADSVLPAGAATSEQENFFEGIDTTLPGLASRLEGEEHLAPFLRSALVEIEQQANAAYNAATPTDPSPAGLPLLNGLNLLNQLIAQVEASQLSAAKADLLVHLRTKQAQFQEAAHEALGIKLLATVDAPPDPAAASAFFPRRQQTFQMAVPGQTFTITVRLFNQGKQAIEPSAIRLDVPEGWVAKALKQDLKKLASGENASAQFQVTVPGHPAYTRPYWHRNDPRTETLYTIDEPKHASLPLPPFPVSAQATYTLAGKSAEIQAVAQVKEVDPIYGQMEHPLTVGPPISVELQSDSQVMAIGITEPRTIEVAIRNHTTGPLNATVRLQVPQGWKVSPDSQAANFEREGERNTYSFSVTPGALQPQRYSIKAVATNNGNDYSEGFHAVHRADIGSFNFYRPALAAITAVKVTVPKKLHIGYIMGAGDDIPATLKQLGIPVEIISPGELASGDLSRFNTIITGIRAYDVHSDVRENNHRLLDFVSRGGTLIVQYNANTAAFNAGQFTPYPATAGSARVSVEEAPVEALAPEDVIFHSPNVITARDFDGWVQERGINFFSQWDKRFQPLLASHDPGEELLQGGLLRASYGKGTYILTGYAFFRQLPAGVPGATRLFVNLLSSGHRER